MSDGLYVHIVESPAPSELRKGDTEGKALCSFLDIAKIPYSYNLVVNLDQFKVAMTDDTEESVQKFGRLPTLHLSTHGGEEGIQLTSQRRIGRVIPWAKLAGYIRPIYKLINNDLIVCMSCCGGAHGTQMAKVLRKKAIPFKWIMGTSTKIEIPDAALAYSIFYRRLHCGFDSYDHLLRVIEAVRDASGISDFDIWDSEHIQEDYSKELILKYIEEYLEKK